VPILHRVSWARSSDHLSSTNPEVVKHASDGDIVDVPQSMAEHQPAGGLRPSGEVMNTRTSLHERPALLGVATGLRTRIEMSSSVQGQLHSNKRPS
jgi:hypothetical protein